VGFLHFSRSVALVGGVFDLLLVLFLAFMPKISLRVYIEDLITRYNPPIAFLNFIIPI
jgi:hypothetical protein